MGSVIAQKVVAALTEAGFPTERAYPGKPFPKLEGPVAAVGLKGVDSTTMTATVEVRLLSPGKLGGAACEEAALEALRVLWALGGACTQGACAYDRVSGTFSVAIEAKFTQPVTSGEDSEGETSVLSGFRVSIDEVSQPNAVSFRAKLATGAEAEYVSAQAEAVGSHGGALAWTIRLEEQIPPGVREPEDPEGEFVLTLADSTGIWEFAGCRWTAVTREYTSQGLHRVREGLALSRKGAENGELAV